MEILQNMLDQKIHQQWQAVKDGPKMSDDNKYNTSDLITYKLIDDTDPSLGILIHYNYGDWDSGYVSQKQALSPVCDKSDFQLCFYLFLLWFLSLFFFGLIQQIRIYYLFVSIF